MNKNVVVVHFRKVKTLKISFVITLLIIQRISSVSLFSTAHYKLVIVLHKNALFHFLELLLGANFCSKALNVPRESLMKGKDQYSWPPGHNQFRSPSLNTDKISFLIYKTSFLNQEVNCTELFPSARIPWTKK